MAAEQAELNYLGLPEGTGKLYDADAIEAFINASPLHTQQFDVAPSEPEVSPWEISRRRGSLFARGFPRFRPVDFDNHERLSFYPHEGFYIPPKPERKTNRDPELWTGYVGSFVSAPHAVVSMRSGHGITTLSQYLYRYSQEMVHASRVIPVRVTLDDADTWSPGDVPTRIQRKAMQGVVNMSGWNSLYEIDTYAKMIGALDEESTLLMKDPVYRARYGYRDVVSPEGLEKVTAHRQALQEVLQQLEGDPKNEFAQRVLARLTPNFALPFKDLVAHIRRLGYRIGIQADLSSTLSRTATPSYNDAVTRLHDGIRGMVQEVNEGKRFPDVNQVYFAPNEAVGLLREQDPMLDEAPVRPYTYKDFAGMLALQYPGIQHEVVYQALESLPEGVLHGTIEEAVAEFDELIDEHLRKLRYV